MPALDAGRTVAAPPEAAEAPSTEPAAPSPEGPAEPAADRPSPPTSVPQSGGLPIQEVLAHLHTQDAAERALPPPPEAPARKRRSTWDFMDDDPLEDVPPSRPEGGRASESAPAAAIAPPVDPGKDAVSTAPAPDGAGERWRKARSAVSNFFSGPGEPNPLLVAGLALAIAVAVAVALYSGGTGAPDSRPGPPAQSAGSGEGAQPGGRSDPFAASSPYVASGEAVPAEGQEEVDGSAAQGVAYVAASLLSCRAAPAQQALRVRNLSRGQEVQVLGFDGDWASLAYRGGQCWAQAQYLSPVPPL